jgi:hypothetical protein
MSKEETPNNVIKFPKEKLSNPANIQSQDDVLQQIVEYKTSFANDVSEILSQHIFGELARSGINFESQIDDLFPSMILVSESIQSLHLKASGVHHPLQDFAADVFDDSVEELLDKDEKIDYNKILEDDKDKNKDK